MSEHRRKALRPHLDNRTAEYVDATLAKAQEENQAALDQLNAQIRSLKAQVQQLSQQLQAVRNEAERASITNQTVTRRQIQRIMQGGNEE